MGALVARFVGGKYQLGKKLSNGDLARGIPELWTANDLGDTYYVKIWRRRPNEMSDVLALWNREVRSLMRLQGYPGADELFVKLKDLGTSTEEFYVVLEGGRRLLLSEALKDRSKFPALTNLGEVNRRRSLWEGLLRVAEGLSILHSEGTLHRALSSSSIFFSPDTSGDFRLSGFEWSLRIAGSDGAAARVVKTTAPRGNPLQPTEGEFSTATDWFDFGLVCAETLGVPVRVRNRAALIKSVEDASSLRESERRFIIRLLTDTSEDQLVMPEEITADLRNMVRELNTATSGYGRELVLAIRLEPGSEFCRTIERVSAGAAPQNDQKKQLEWIKNDLRGDVRVIARHSQQLFVLRGERLSYRARQWSVGSIRTWDVAFCESTEYSPRSLDDDQAYSIGDRPLDIISYSQATKNLTRVRDRAVQWDRLFPFRITRKKLPSDLADVHDFFRVTQQLDVALIAARICPVEIINVIRTSSTTQVVATPFEETERNELATLLRLSSPSAYLRDWAGLGASSILVEDDETESTQAKFSFLEQRTLVSEGSSDQWRLVSAAPHANGPRYTFEAVGAPPIKPGKRYLASGHGGTIAQVKRRHAAIEALLQQHGLLQLIATPREVSRDGREQLPSGRGQFTLDGSKMEALARLWRLRPSFAIQGPPGTGKTTLISSFAERLLDSDPSAQILLTAHSHHTVDDVRTKLSELFSSPGSEVIMIRLGAKEPTDQDVETVTNRMLSRLANSTLAKAAPDFLRDRIASIVGSSGDDVGQELGTMQQLVQDSANVTFATLNSGELFDLSERGRRFDWSIIEEAGKAHGFDMAVALQESHRLLLIGDHFQLPPFNAGIYQQLLGDPLRVQKAIRAAEQYGGWLIDVSLVDDEPDGTSLIDRCDRWSRMVTLFGHIFKASLGSPDDDAGPAATLTDQHRMHPDIADLVGRIFYKSDDGSLLKSPPATRERFAAPAPFVIRNSRVLPEQRVIWWNVPWVQKTHFAIGETSGLFESESEAQAVVQILDEIAPRDGTPCELQILSPYTDQITSIRRHIDSAYQHDELKHMFQAPFALDKHKRMGATVDEFQGSEADIVIVSLVRNNALVPFKSLGFLKERTRMNVLLSRARHKLVIVGSWQFFSTRHNEATTVDDEYYYITEMMEEMERARRQGTLGLAGSAL